MRREPETVTTIDERNRAIASNATDLKKTALFADGSVVAQFPGTVSKELDSFKAKKTYGLMVGARLSPMAK